MSVDSDWEPGGEDTVQQLSAGQARSHNSNQYREKSNTERVNLFIWYGDVGMLSDGFGAVGQRRRKCLHKAAESASAFKQQTTETFTYPPQTHLNCSLRLQESKQCDQVRCNLENKRPMRPIQNTRKHRWYSGGRLQGGGYCAG